MTFLLRNILLDPRRSLQLDNVQLNQLISEARSSRLLASLGIALQHVGVYEQISPNVQRHIRSAILIHEKQKRDLAYDCGKIKLALDSVGEKLVLLKGAAYLIADLPTSSGRLITDIDIIVPHQRIEQAEKALNKYGWESSHVSTYDDHYYRKWGHEIPPLTNRARETTLDVHHNILPPTAAPSVNATLLFDNIVEVKPGLYTLSSHDMVIHSATHLFHEGEFHHGLRDLWDLDRMLRYFPLRDPDFWKVLVSRAMELELLGSLFHGLNYAQQVFSTPIPNDVMVQAGSWSMLLRKPIMDFLFLRAFRPDHPACALPLTGLALNMLYVRSHFLRMPLYLLLPHLARKAWIKRFTDKSPMPGNQLPENI
ncbi:MAG: nucleotidyltransferase family protein [Halioglobus sp.]